MTTETLQTTAIEVKFQEPTKGRLTGVAAVYGGEPDSFGDVIAAGAFTATLADWEAKGRDLPMLADHLQSRTIGKWTRLSETPQGLIATGKITLDSTDGADAYALLKDGAKTGLSIGYRVKSSAPRDGGGRVLTEVELVEISLVTIPANDAARVTETKGQQAAAKEAKTMALDNAPELDAKLTTALDRIADLEAKAQAQPAVATDDAEETPLEVKAFDSFTRRGDANMDDVERKALNSSTSAEGGFLVPEDFRAELLRTVTEFSPMRQVSRVSRTGRDEVIIPKRLTKLSGGWTAELADRAESEPTFGQIKIPVHELGVFTAISNQNLEDSAFDMSAELTADFAESFGEMESEAFIVGDGVGKPSGILNNVDIPVTNSAAAGIVNADDLITVFYKLKAAYRANGAWMMGADTLAEVRKLKTANGDYIWRESLADGQPPTILGRPVYEAPHMPSPAANAKAVLFGDFGRAYRIVDRVDISVLRDPYTLATKSAVRFHARRRVGGDVVQPEAARVLQLA